MTTTRTPDRLLDEIIQGRGRNEIFRRRLVLNKESNWLLALTLNAFTKATDGQRLSDLEQQIVTTYRDSRVGEEFVRTHGNLNKKIDRAFRSEIFSGRFAELNPTQSYSHEDLRRDAPRITQAIMAKPNVMNVDIEAIHAGRADIRDFPRPRRELVAEYGCENILAFEPNVTPPNPKFTIKAEKFACLAYDNDSIGYGDINEPYWLFGTAAKGKAFFTSTSHAFPNITNNMQMVDFWPFEGNIWTKDGSPADLPDVPIACQIMLMEHDWGDMDDIAEAFAIGFAAVEYLAEAFDAPGWLVSLLSAIGFLVGWFLGVADDDFIAVKNLVFSRQSLTSFLKKVGDTKVQLHTFSNGSATYFLALKLAREM